MATTMRRFARRLSQIARLNAPDKDVPSVVLTRPSTASIFQFDEDAAYFRNLGIKTNPTGMGSSIPNNNPSYLSAPSRIAKRHKVINNNSDLSDIHSISSGHQDASSFTGISSSPGGPVDERERHRRGNSEMLARTARFLSIMYAFLLIIIGAMCTMFNINERENYARDAFFIVICVMGIGWLAFLHYDILKYKRWAMEFVKPFVAEEFADSIDDDEEEEEERNEENEEEDLERGGNENNDLEEGAAVDGGGGERRNGGGGGRIATISGGRNMQNNADAYDSVSLNTAMIFDYVGQKSRKSKAKTAVNRDFDSISMASMGFGGGGKNRIETGYRYFQGKHSNDFYLKTGMIIFCFGSIMHLGIGTVQQVYFFVHHDAVCQEPLKLTTAIVRVIFSFYQLFIAFKYSNIIINRFKNMARFALMHLLGTAISLWLDTIVDEVIDDFVDRRLSEANATNMEDSFEEMLAHYDEPFYDHLVHSINCSKLAIVSNQSMSALPYFYPFTIEFNIAIASIWYMIWTNIGKVNDKSLFHSVKQEIVEDENGEEEIHYRSSGLALNVDCHASNRGLFLGLAFLLVIIITIVIFFSTIKKDVYSHFSVAIYSLQIAALTICSFVVIPLAYFKIQQLDVVGHHHRDNAFTIMDDILVLVPIPFYFVHYSLAIIASIADISHEEDFERTNNILLSVIELLTIAQVMIQSPFIVDGLRRCANGSQVRLRKPGRELVIFALILNVTLWILNTFELKSVEVYHAPHHYFGEFTSMIINHATLPIMLFYRFHSSVCLSNIWKYAYEKDE